MRDLSKFPSPFNFSVTLPVCRIDQKVLSTLKKFKFHLHFSPDNNDIYTRVQSHKDWIRTIIEPENGSSSTKTPPTEISPSDGASLKRHKSHVIIAWTVVILLMVIWS